jgi:endonuclease YncB( thermonuclease family)
MGCFQSHSRKFDGCTYDNTDPYYPRFTRGKVVKVYDGDTIHIVADSGDGRLCRYMIRMYGYDSPEIGTERGKEAKRVLEARIMNKVVKVDVCKEKEKYGRVLATVHDSRGEINRWMVSQGYGTPYYGGKK